MKIQVGDKAPSFILVDTEKQKVDLQEFRGKNVVLLFFPLAFTGVCTKELCSVRDEKSLYDNLNAEILAISIDTVFTLQKFKEEQNYTFKLLSDFNKEAARAYGTLYEDFVLGMKGVAKRSAFVINKDGIVKYAEVLENARDLPDFAKIKETMSSLS